jgi:hypothetical protein
MNVMLDLTTRPFLTMFRFVIGNRVLSTYFETSRLEIVGVSLPLLKEDERFRVPNLALDLRLEGSKMYFSQRNRGRAYSIAEVDVAARSARALGFIPDHLLRYPMRVGNGLAFVSVRLSSDLHVRKPSGKLVNLTDNGHVWDGGRCGRDLIVSKELDPERIVIERLDASGRRLEQLSAGPADWSPTHASRRQDLVHRPPAAAEHPAPRSARLHIYRGSRSDCRRRRTPTRHSSSETSAG